MALKRNFLLWAKDPLHGLLPVLPAFIFSNTGFWAVPQTHLLCLGPESLSPDNTASIPHLSVLKFHGFNEASLYIYITYISQVSLHFSIFLLALNIWYATLRVFIFSLSHKNANSMKTNYLSLLCFLLYIQSHVYKNT